MKVPLNWLRDYVDITLSPTDLANRLMMSGLEVTGRRDIGSNWGNVVIGQITAVNSHPNADRLALPTIDLGGEQQTVVCGAPNLNVGDKIAFARVGATLFDNDTDETFTLKSAKIRGVLSSGMVCSEKELGISNIYAVILVLPPEAPLGAPLADYMGDVIIDLDVTPNRPDCLSIIGIAREVSALTGQSTRLPEAGYKEYMTTIEKKISVDITASDLCPRYCASFITGIKVAESPRWMQERLVVSGMRPINNIVDITNYVMLEYGQPLHAFDYDLVSGGKIVVRRATKGETLISLDGAERTLSEDMLVIADKAKAVALAGVMGSTNSEVTESTTSILLESANFHPANIHHTSRALFLSSEASMRFERGVRPELAMEAIKRATHLIIQLTDGKAAEGIIDVYPGKTERKPVVLATGEIKRILGIEFSVAHIVKTLTSLGFKCQATDSKSKISVIPPYWRGDINLEVDLIEEVARITGYDKIPSTLLGGPMPRHDLDHVLGLKKKLGTILAGYGFHEIISYSLVNMQSLAKLLPESDTLEDEPLRVANPMSVEQEYLRPHLRANLLTALSMNQKHDAGIRLFELGKTYLAQTRDLPREPEVLCGILSGLRLDKSWHGHNEMMNYYDVKGVVESLFASLGMGVDFEECSDGSFHPGKQTAIFIEGNKLGVVGELHPKVLDAFDISGTAGLFEIYVPPLIAFTEDRRMFQSILRFPPIDRDLALVVDIGIPHQQIYDIIKSFSLVMRAIVFDVYACEKVPPGKKSMAFRVTFQSSDRTLTDEEVDEVQQKILDKLTRQIGATLRS